MISLVQVIEFSDLDKTKVKFVRQVLLSLLLTEKEDECVEAFTRVPGTGKLALFKEGMRLFIHRYILSQGATSKSGEAELLKSRVAVAERLLVNQDKKVRF
jgi:nucleolar MIF4G domain-containing protein 1